MESCGLSSAEYHVYLAGVNRLSACRDFGVHSWQNDTRYRDGVNVLWCRSHLVWLVFEGSIPTCACFHSENFFVTFIKWSHAALQYAPSSKYQLH